MNKKEDLIAAIKNMNRAQLTQYHSAAILADKCIDAVGVVLIFTLLWFSNILIAIPGVIFLYLIAQIGAGLGETIDYIEERLFRAKQRKDEDPPKKDEEIDK